MDAGVVVYGFAMVRTDFGFLVDSFKLVYIDCVEL